MAEKPAALTAYVILRRDPGPDSYANPWREDGPRQQARSAKQAIRQALELRELRTQTDTDVSGTPTPTCPAPMPPSQRAPSPLPDGECGQPAVYAIHVTGLGGHWSCERCARFYATNLVYRLDSIPLPPATLTPR